MVDYNNVPCTETVDEEPIASIIRCMSEKISSEYANICTIVSTISGKPIERNIEGKEPRCLMDELLWQRSMLCRMEEELFDISHKLGC